MSVLTRHQYSRGESDISVTQLLGPPQIRILKMANKDRIVEDVSDMFWALMGTNIHKLLEDHANETVQTEERLFMTVNGWVVSGQIDMQGDGSIVDWKFTSVYSAMNPKVEWINQLNIYAYLVEKIKGVRVDKLQVVAILRDWTRSKAVSAKYPKTPIVKIDLPLWSYEEREQYLFERVRVHQEASGSHDLGGPIPDCTEEERWFRRGKNIRCEDYCTVRDFCEQYQRSKTSASSKPKPEE